eukprot:UN13182
MFNRCNQSIIVFLLSYIFIYINLFDGLLLNVIFIICNNLCVIYEICQVPSQLIYIRHIILFISFISLISFLIITIIYIIYNYTIFFFYFIIFFIIRLSTTTKSTNCSRHPILWFC